MQKSAIFSPILGTKKDSPSILLSENYSPDNSDVRLQDGELWRTLFRGKLLLEKPLAIGSVAATNGSAAVVGTNTAWVKGLKGRVITINSVAYTILSVTDATNLTLTATHTGAYTGTSYLIGTSQTDATTPDGYSILRYHRFVANTTGTEYYFAFTKKHAYVWSGAWGAWDQVFECASDVTSWSTESYFNYLIATNNSDAPQFCIPSSSQTFAALSTIPGSDVGSYCTKAKFVVEYEGYLIFLHYTDASSNYLPDDAIWCDYVDLVNWNTGDASSGGFEGAGGISGVGKKAGFLYVFKEDSEPHKIWLVSSADVFDKTKMNGRPGCKSPDSIVNDKDGNLFYFARDFTIREIDNGVISLPIDSTVKNITPALLSKIQATFCDEYSELYWSIPVISDGVTVTENTRIVCYKDGLWNNRKIAVVAFGKYAATSTMTWDTLPFSTWDTWGWDKWDTPSGDTGFLFLTCSDSTGKTFALNGSEIDALTGLASDGWFILTTNFKSLFEYKRLLNMQFVFRAESSASVVTVYIKQDGEAEWQNADNASLAGSGEEFIFVDVPCDYRARNFQIKISGQNKFRFLGVIFEYEADGDR